MQNCEDTQTSQYTINRKLSKRSENKDVSVVFRNLINTENGVYFSNSTRGTTG